MTSADASIMEVVFRAAGIKPNTRVRLPLEVDLDAVLLLTTPVEPSEFPEMPHIVEHVRALLCDGAGHQFDGRPLPDIALTLEGTVARELDRYPQPEPNEPDRLYVMEFQGYPGQYLKIGHTKNLKRRLAAHRLAARPHGYALLQGWVSPCVANAQPLELQVFNVASFLHGMHSQERFHNLPFCEGLSITRAVFEFNTDWPTPEERVGS